MILGIGNAFEGDFSVPCLVLEALAEERLGEAVDLYYLGDDPRFSGGFFYGTDLAVVFTVLKLGAPPGSLHFWDMGVFCQHSPWIAEESVAVRYLEEVLARVELAGGAPSRFFFLWSEPHRTEGFSLSTSARKAVWRAVRAVKVILVEHGICPADVLRCSAMVGSIPTATGR